MYVCVSGGHTPRPFFPPFALPLCVFGYLSAMMVVVVVLRLVGGVGDPALLLREPQNKWWSLGWNDGGGKRVSGQGGWGIVKDNDPCPLCVKRQKL